MSPSFQAERTAGRVRLWRDARLSSHALRTHDVPLWWRVDRGLSPLHRTQRSLTPWDDDLNRRVQAGALVFRVSAGTHTVVQVDGNMSGAGVSPGAQQNRPCPARGRRRLRLSATCVNAGWRRRRSDIPALFHFFFFFKETILGRFIFFSNGKLRVFNVSSFVCARCLPRGAKRCSRRGVEHTPVCSLPGFSLGTHEDPLLGSSLAPSLVSGRREPL